MRQPAAVLVVVVEGFGVAEVLVDVDVSDPDDPEVDDGLDAGASLLLDPASVLEVAVLEDDELLDDVRLSVL